MTAYPLSEAVATGQANLPGLMNEERDAINDLHVRLAAAEGGSLIPSRLGAGTGMTLGDANDGLQNGFYYLAGVNGPAGADEGFLSVTSHDPSLLVQTFVRYGTDRVFMRRRVGAWQPWFELAKQQDTGWRDVGGLLAAGFEAETAGSVRIRRVGSSVRFKAQMRRTTAVADAAAAALIMTQPVGFRGVLYEVFGSVSVVGGRTGTLMDYFGGRLETYGVPGAWAVANWVYAGGTWLTDDDWPAVLPGTAI